MTALDAVAAYLPDRRVPLDELAGPLALTPSQVTVLRRIHGLSEVRRRRPGQTLLDLLTAAVDKLDGLRGQQRRVRYVLYARAVPVTTPFPINPLHELCRRTGLTHASAFTVTHHACPTSLLAIDLAGRLLSADHRADHRADQSADHKADRDPTALALIVVGETVFTQDTTLAPELRVFGEAAGACLVSASGTRDRVLSYACHQRGDMDHWLSPGSDHTKRFTQEYNELLAGVIKAAVRRAGLGLDDIKLILPHNVNRVSWNRVCRMLGFPAERVMLHNLPLVGHAFAADAFINYCAATQLSLLEPGDRYLAASAGYGATFSAMVFKH